MRGEAAPPQYIGAQPTLPRAPARRPPHFVIPAKAGIQRGRPPHTSPNPPSQERRPHHRHSGEGRNPEGRWGVWQTFSSASEAKPASQERRPPPLRHSGEGRNPEGRNVAAPPQCIGGRRPPPSSFREGRQIPPMSNHPPRTAGRPPPRHSGEGRNPEGRWGVGQYPVQPPTFVSRPAPHHRHSGEGRNPEGRWATGQYPGPPPVDPPNLNPIKISLKIPITSPNNLPETPKGREAGKPLTYNLVRSSLI